MTKLERATKYLLELVLAGPDEFSFDDFCEARMDYLVELDKAERRGEVWRAPA